jgi:TolA-binding protein
MPTRHLRTMLLPVALLASGCLATRSDIERLELTVRAMDDSSRARMARSDAADRAALTQAMQLLTQQFQREFSSVSDSVRQVATALQRLQGDVSLSMHDLRTQLTTLQEGIGQSQRRIDNLRNTVEANAGAPRPADPAAPAAAAPGTPSAATLWSTGRSQLTRNATGSARMNFQTLIDQYPTHDLASAAQHQIANSYAAEGNRAAADSVFALVVEKYPASEVAPNALYKRAMLARDIKDSTRAKAYFEQIVAKYPKSNERTLADEFLNPPKKP